MPTRVADLPPAPANPAVSVANVNSALPTAASAGSADAVPPGVSAGAGGSNTAASSLLELPSSNAAYLHNPEPDYPHLSRQRNEQGKVVVNVFIGVDGLPLNAVVKVSSGFERLDAAALSAAKAWRYVPGKRGGVPEAMWFAVPINFVME
jgi:protein TonB